MTHLDDVTLPLDGPRPETSQFLRGFIGSAVLLVAINAAEPLFFGEGYFASLTYHPFWIVILLAAVQHGLFVGLSVVGLATMMMDWPSRPVGMDITDHYVDIAVAPAQWLIAALLIGLYRQQQIRRQRATLRENDRLREVNRTLAGEIHRLDAFVARAELAAATQALPQGGADGADGPLAALDRLAAADADQRPVAFAEAARACLPVPVAWVMVDRAGQPALVAATDEDVAFPAVVPADLPFATAGRILFLTPDEDGNPKGTPTLCRLVAPEGDALGLLLAQASKEDADALAPGLNALGRALEDSLRLMPDPLPVALLPAPEVKEPVRLHA